MKIACVGAGPAGLYFAISMKLRDTSHEITVFERNPPGVTFGWGVVFSDLTVENITANDPVSAKTITEEFAHWDDIDVHFGGECITSSGHGFIGIGRKRLLEILQDRARELGVALEFEAECDPADPKWRGYDLVIASDGINSRFRDAYADAFGVDVDTRANKFVWLGTSKVFDAFTFAFEKTEHGWIWAHAYRFAPDCSTFIIECSEETWRGFGFDRMDQAEAIAACEKLFAKYLDGHKLQSNATHLRGSAAWLNFRRIKCERWSTGNVILLGDAAHTAHFSVGSGTKLALEDAIKLADVLNRPGISLESGLDEYVAERNLEVLKLQNSARNSTEWFETLERYTHFEPLQFAYSLLTRSQRISHENLRLRDREWLEGVERWFWKRATEGRSNKTAPPMFAPFKLREMTRSRTAITVSPMAMYSAVDGTPNDFHFVHLGERAMGGAGLLFTEMTCVSPEGRISPGCTGMWNDEHVAGVEADRRFRPRELEGEDLPPARPFGREGLDPRRLGRGQCAAARRQLAGHGRERRGLVAGQPGAGADDPRGHGQGARRVRGGGAHGRRMRLRHGRASRRARLSAVGVPHAAAEPAHRRIWRESWRTACAIRSKSSRRCAKPGRRTARCRCASRPPTGPATKGSPPMKPSRSRKLSRGTART